MDAEDASKVAGLALGALTKLATDKARELGTSTLEGVAAHAAIGALAQLAQWGAEAAIAAAVSREFTSESIRFIDETV